MRRASVLWRTSASAGVVSGARAARTLSSRERGRQSLGERLGLHQLDAPRASTLAPWTRRPGAASEGTTPQLGPPTGENLGRRPEGAPWARFATSVRPPSVVPQGSMSTPAAEPFLTRGRRARPSVKRQMRCLEWHVPAWLRPHQGRLSPASRRRFRRSRRAATRDGTYEPQRRQASQPQ
jgi:hypothetical protein